MVAGRRSDLIGLQLRGERRCSRTPRSLEYANPGVPEPATYRTGSTACASTYLPAYLSINLSIDQSMNQSIHQSIISYRTCLVCKDTVDPVVMQLYHPVQSLQLIGSHGAEPAGTRHETTASNQNIALSTGAKRTRRHITGKILIACKQHAGMIGSLFGSVWGLLI